MLAAVGGATLIGVDGQPVTRKVHDTSEWPVLLLGKASGALKGDQHFRAANGNLSSALLTIANIFGAGLKTIGKGNGQTSSELSGLRVA